jgi:DNA repair protein SbcC/Rad50
VRTLRLDMHGFAVFREPTVIDLTNVDFFVMVGPTGSGKSTVLDAICFALYGTVPRWDDRRSIENALAPSATEARVRLVFEASGRRYVATRVIRRDGKGRVATAHAGLEELPPGFDLADFDAAPAERASLGTVLAGTPAEMEPAVLAAVGLPYEQFTSSVMLPQGEFARFLHAKPRERQDILVNLLGLGVYRRIAERAGAAQREAEAAAAASRSLLLDMTDDDGVEAAERAMAAAQALVGHVETALPDLASAQAAGEAAGAELARAEADLALLDAVRAPADISALADEISLARDAAEASQATIVDAEEYEEKLREELASAGDRAALQRILDTHAELRRLSTRGGALAATMADLTSRHEAALTTLGDAQESLAGAEGQVTAAQQSIEAAQTADRAAALRGHLAVGEPCPVCDQTVTALPPPRRGEALMAARTALATAEKGRGIAVATVQARDLAVRQLDRELAGLRAQHEESADRVAQAQARLAGAPPASTVESDLAAIAAAEAALAEASEAVRVARQGGRSAATQAKRAEQHLRDAWRTYDSTRDTLAALVPPAADRDDIAASWVALQDWAGQARGVRAVARDRALRAAEAALGAMSDQVRRLDELFASAGAGPVSGTRDVAAYRQNAAVHAERAAAAYERARQRQEQAARLAEQVARHDRAAQVAKALALHLRADRFERWLLAEALDALVAGASRTMRELTAGQYDLGHEKGEFYVIDHADAGLRRGVRTLSGGETFQASLALALALAEQLTGLSASSASLESIMLDEGFGTLDSTTLDTVAATLENLAARGDRMVGVVTHVAALAERVPVRFDVTKDARGSSRVARVS